jgi:hypothetical protein
MDTKVFECPAGLLLSIVYSAGQGGQGANLDQATHLEPTKSKRSLVLLIDVHVLTNDEHHLAACCHSHVQPCRPGSATERKLRGGGGGGAGAATCCEQSVRLLYGEWVA